MATHLETCPYQPTLGRVHGTLGPKRLWANTVDSPSDGLHCRSRCRSRRSRSLTLGVALPIFAEPAEECDTDLWNTSQEPRLATLAWTQWMRPIGPPPPAPKPTSILLGFIAPFRVSRCATLPGLANSMSWVRYLEQIVSRTRAQPSARKP